MDNDFDLNVALGLDYLSKSDDEVEDDNSSTSSDSDIRVNTPKGNCDNETGDNETGYDDVIEKKMETGCSLVDVEQAYLLYCEYARQKGFGVRRGDQRYKGKSTEIRWEEFTCSCSGIPDCKRSNAEVGKYRRLILRSDCKAKIRVYRIKEGEWTISLFEKQHNHTLFPKDQTFLLRSHRNLTYAKSTVLEALHSLGVPVSRACVFMEKEAGGIENLGFTRKDAYNHFAKLKLAANVENGDVRALLEFFNKKNNEEPFYFWKAQYDDEHHLKNVFFRDTRCAVDYEAFGDVLLVDSTYRTNMYNLICTPFVGINHHRKNLLFGVAFLSDETTTTFEWLFETFLQSMNGKEPQVVFSDQCMALMNAVDSKFPNAKHRLCQWHINKNAAKQWGSLLGNAAFKKSWFRCMNEVETEDEFEVEWTTMINSYDLQEEPWFINMHRIRHRWASVFTQHIFTAGTLATSRCEGTNRIVKLIGQPKGTLMKFVMGFEEILTRWRATESADDAFSIWSLGQFVKNFPFLTEVANVYTAANYKKFEIQCSECLKVEILDNEAPPCHLGAGNLKYHASSIGSTRNPRTIIYNKVSKIASCSCCMWKKEGIVCRHIIKMYQLKNVWSLPDTYVLKRWTKRAKDVVDKSRPELTVTEKMIPNLDFVKKYMKHSYDLACQARWDAKAQEFLWKMSDCSRRDLVSLLSHPSPNKSDKGTQDSPLKSQDPKFQDSPLKSQELYSEDSPLKFQDPKKVKEKGFINARNHQKPVTTKSKGKKKPMGASTPRKANKRFKGAPNVELNLMI